jgi:integrase
MAAITVGDLCDRYLDYLRAMDRKPATLSNTEDFLRLLLLPLWGRSAAIEPSTAQARYKEVAAIRAAATHQRALGTASAVWTWGTKERLVKTNPWTSVRKLGRPNKGKPQLTFDEARKLMETCLDRVVADDGALGVMLALLCGLRSSEIMGLTVRAVDNRGRTLRVMDAKTKAGVRPLDLPEQLIPAVAARVAHRSSDDRLLDAPGGLKDRASWLIRALNHYCELAGVPRVVPHSLRGTFAAVAVDAAELPQRVAAALGHTSFAMTRAHYVPPDVLSQAEQRKRTDLAGKN